jgi:hypothetical protein
VDAADYVVWRNTLNQAGVGLAADGNDNYTIDSGDLAVWRTHFGQTAAPGILAAVPHSQSNLDRAIPEPATLALLMFAAVGWCVRRRPAA